MYIVYCWESYHSLINHTKQETFMFRIISWNWDINLMSYKHLKTCPNIWNMFYSLSAPSCSVIVPRIGVMHQIFSKILANILQVSPLIWLVDIISTFEHFKLGYITKHTHYQFNSQMPVCLFRYPQKTFLLACANVHKVFRGTVVGRWRDWSKIVLWPVNEVWLITVLGWFQYSKPT